MEEMAGREGRTVDQLSLDEQEALWQQAKRTEKGHIS
jgi:uncharacterized protein YabN with tetrapyrrole methylase and pyrophosphatase domain